MGKNELYIARCLELATKGSGDVAPNPMVGAVVVANDKIIGEGYHHAYGQAHAEKNAIDNIEAHNIELLSKSTLYVNLEPCAHHGNTPPCAELIVRCKIPKVIIGNIDPNPKVAGQGINILRNAGIEVITGVLENKCREFNKRFFTFIEKKRPYVFLKWAQTADGFLDKKRNSSIEPPLKISNELTKMLTHKIRTENQAIIVGTNTALLDNPKLSARMWTGRNPIRIVIDAKKKIPENFNVFDGKQPTIIITEENIENSQKNNVCFVNVNFKNDFINNLLTAIYSQNIHSLLVEGGAHLLNSFIKSNLWDCAQVEISPIKIYNGIAAPILTKLPTKEINYQGHRILEFDNKTTFDFEPKAI
ncbi:MAG: bifunctional diaminohydroxyphosphoribosylaminopyrimidine deaminase/5-amino-6-(5-phosphoribosylamino)uracil reductase RibD [Paludibacter sp.]|nr:bifunctional diaminohydroxyphosphoribosylaminopyrimidine deaminase/5-amino-6-(5-phosphoribosylamino)uracil reductase RibD [Paludibacter sp.]